MFDWAARLGAVALLLGLGSVEGVGVLAVGAVLLLALLTAGCIATLATGRPTVSARVLHDRSIGWQGRGIAQLDPNLPGRPQPRAPARVVAGVAG